MSDSISTAQTYLPQKLLVLLPGKALCQDVSRLVVGGHIVKGDVAGLVGGRVINRALGCVDVLDGTLFSYLDRQLTLLV